ncbi:mucin-binding protein [Alloscardovia macacae]|nr:hypothetical protein [Alloscardovia macacae]
MAHAALAVEDSDVSPPEAGSSAASGESRENVISVGPDAKLDEAIANAPDGAVLEITGTHTLGSTPITIHKSMTLRAGADGGVIQTTQRADAHIIFEGKGKNFILGSENEEPVLTLDGVTVKAAAGSFEARKGWLIDKGGLDINGADVEAKISGGTITNGRTAETYGYHVGALQVRNNAVVTEISGGNFTGSATAMAVDSGSVVKKISGGTFTRGTNSSPWDTVRVKYATIEDITGGTFTSNYDAALRVEEGGHIKHISGGTFHTETAAQYLAYLQAFRLDYGAALSIYTGVNDTTGADFTGVDKISGGDFSGTHAIFMLGNNAQPYEKKSMVTIGEISGGTFTSTLEKDKDKTGRRIKKDAVLLGRQSYIGRISGGTFRTKFDSPALHLAYTQGSDANTRPRATIAEISGGIFISDKSYSLDIEKGLVDTISGGEFYSANTSGVSTSSNGAIRQITGGKFYNNYSPAECSSWNENVPLIKASYYATPRDSKPQGLLLEPGLTSDIGKGRYWTKLCRSKNGAYDYNVVPPNAVLPEGYVIAGYDSDYGFRPVKAEDGTTDFVLKNGSIYFKKNAEGEVLPASISGSNNDWYAENGYEKLEKPIYALAQSYRTEDVALKEDHQNPDGTTEVRHYRYLMKTPTVTFDVNAPRVVNNAGTSGTAARSTRAANVEVLPHTGEVPATMTIKPFAYDRYANSISEKNSQVFKVPGNEGGLAIEGYKFTGFNTAADGSGVRMREGEYYAMPSANVTLYAQWERVTQDEPESKTLTRTIRYIDKVTKAPIHDPQVQSVTLTRTNVRNLVTNAVTGGEWSTTKFEAVVSPSVDRYGAPDKATVPELAVNGETEDITVDVMYPQGTKDEPESKTLTRTIRYIDKVTKAPIRDPQVQTVTLTRTNVRNLVTGVVTEGEWSTAKFEAVNSPSVENYGAPDTLTVPELVVNGDTKDITVDVMYPQGTKDETEEKNITRTITYVDEVTHKEISTHVIQSVTLKRTNERNLVTGDVKKGTWSTAKFEAVTSPTVDKYGAPDRDAVGAMDVTDETQNFTVMVTYPRGTENVREEKIITRTITFVDEETGQQIADSILQKVTLERTNVRDLVTSAVTEAEWSTAVFPEVQIPAIEGYQSPTLASIPEVQVNGQTEDEVIRLAFSREKKIVKTDTVPGSAKSVQDVKKDHALARTGVDLTVLTAATVMLLVVGVASTASVAVSRKRSVKRMK